MTSEPVRRDARMATLPDPANLRVMIPSGQSPQLRKESKRRVHVWL